MLRSDLLRTAERDAAVGGGNGPERLSVGRSRFSGACREGLEVSVRHHERAVGEDHRGDVVDADRPAAVGRLDRTDPAAAVVVGTEDADRVDRIPVERPDVDPPGELSVRVVDDRLFVIEG